MFREKLKHLLLTGVIVMSAMQAAVAQSPRDSVKQLSAIVVTAGRSPQHIKEVPQKIEVISAADIKATTALDVTDLLKKNSAVNVIQYPGILSGIGIRGFRPQFSGLNQRTLLLVNGRPAGTTNMGTLDLNFIDHIEVLKGPASALYGSQAMGGVVNIITPQSSGLVKGSVFADGGSFSTWQLGAMAGGNINSRMDFDASATWFDRAGNFKMGNGNFFRSMLGANHSLNRYSNGTDTLVNDTRGDGQVRPNTKYKYYSGSGRLGYRIDSSWRLDLSGSYFNASDVESPGDIFSGEAGAGLKDIERYSSELALTGRIKNNELSARVYYARELSKTFAVRTSTGEVIDTPFVSARNTYQWYGLQLRDRITWGRQKMIVGYDFNRASSRNPSYAAPVNKAQKETTTTPNAGVITHGFYTQGQLSFMDDKLQVNPGIRLDLSTFALYETPGYTRTLGTGRRTTAFISPSISAQYFLLQGLAVHGSIGRAFVTPDAANVAGYSISGKGSGKVAISQGNPDLKNESSLSFESGLKYENSSTGWSADVTWFSTNVRDRIVSRSAPPATPDTLDGDAVTAVTNYFNANKSRIRGLEAAAAYDFGVLCNYRYSLRLFANITRTFTAEDITVNTDGSTTAAAIQNVASANLNYGLAYMAHGGFSARITGRYSGRRWDTDFNNAARPLVYYAPFMTLDLYAGYHFLEHHEVSVSVSNVTDENYYEKRGYNMAGRAFRVRYTFSFGK